MARTTVTVTLSMAPGLVERIDRLAKATGLSRSAWVQQQIANAIDDEEMAVKALTDPLVAPALLGVFKDRDVMRGLANLMGEQLSDQQLQLFTERLGKITKRKPRGKDAQRVKGGVRR
jgi:predicted transcriptional regulator